MKDNELRKKAMGIVSQLFDLAEVPLEKRQQINDKADEYVFDQLRLGDVEVESEQLPNITLEQAITRAKQNLDKIKDVDKHLDDIR